MKKITLVIMLLAGSLSATTSNAQVNIRVNIGSQPVWGPSGYDYAEYYYLPEMDVYYHVPDRQFVFFNGRNWAYTPVLPAYYNRFNLYNTYKVVINEPQPFLRNNFYHARYSNWQRTRQVNIYNSRDSRYYAIEGHPNHDQWMRDRQNGPGYDRDRGNDRGRGWDNDRNNDHNDHNDRGRDRDHNDGHGRRQGGRW